MQNHSKGEKSSSDETMSIGQLAKAANVSNRTIRYYEELGLIIPLTRGSNRYRYYDESHIDRLRLIKMLQESGFALKEIVGALNPILDPQGNVTYSGQEMALKVADSLRNHRVALKRKQQELMTTLEAIDETLKELGYCFNCKESEDIQDCMNCKKGPADIVSLGRRVREKELEEQNA